MTSLMQSTAVALGKYGIRCNALLPGTIKTQLNEEDLADDEKRAYMEKRIPLGRTGVPSDMAGPAVFLASDELSGYVTGSQLLVDGDCLSICNNTADITRHSIRRSMLTRSELRHSYCTCLRTSTA